MRVVSQRLRVSLCSALCFLLFAGGLKAAGFLWDGGSVTDGDWADATNWTTTAPNNDGTDDLTFGGTTRTTNIIKTNWDINSITYAGTAGAFTHAPNASETLTIAAGITNGDSDHMANNIDIILSGSQTWDAGTGDLTFSGDVNLNGNNLILTSTNDTDNITFNGVITGTGNITWNGNPTVAADPALVQLTFANSSTGDNTYSGTLTINGGAVILNRQTAGDEVITGAVTIGDGTNVDMLRHESVQNNQTSSTTDITFTAGTTDSDYGEFELIGGVDTSIDEIISTDAHSVIDMLAGGSILTIGANNGSSTYAGKITGAGQLTKSGTGNITLTGDSTFSNTFNINDGTITVGHVDALGDSGSNTITVVASGATLAFDHSGSNTYDREVIEISGTGEGGAGAIDVIDGDITIDANVDMNADSTIDVASGDFLTLTNGVIESGGSYALTKTGSGQLIIGSATASSYTGDTIVSGGSLLLGGSNLLNDSSDLVLAGGEFMTGSFNETMGTLTLSTHSIIDLGSGGNSDIVFSDSSGTSWTGGRTLTIQNFNDAGDSIRIGTNASGLSATQISQIEFHDPVGYASGIYEATLDASGFLQVSSSVVPEASTWIGMGSLGLLGIAFEFRRRRRKA